MNAENSPDLDRVCESMKALEVAVNDQIALNPATLRVINLCLRAKPAKRKSIFLALSKRIDKVDIRHFEALSFSGATIINIARAYKKGEAEAIVKSANSRSAPSTSWLETRTILPPTKRKAKIRKLNNVARKELFKKH